MAKEFYLSDPMPSGPLGFGERKTDPIVWETLDNLAKIAVIGTVRDYINTAEFDDKAAKGIIKVNPVTGDITNLLKVAAKRIPCAVIDKYVMQYWLDTEPRLKEAENLLQFNRKIM